MKHIEKLNWHDVISKGCTTEQKDVYKMIEWFKNINEGSNTMSKSMLEEKKKDIQRARKSLTTFYNDLKNVDHWEHKVYKEIFTYLEVLGTRLFYYDNATDKQIEKLNK